MARHQPRLRPRDEPRLRVSFRWSDERTLSGFVADPSDLTRKFAVELLLDGLPVKVARADEYVHELARQHVGDGCHGFSFALRDELLGEGVVAEARIANIGTLIGAPIIFGDPAETGPRNDGAGGVRWLGGLRFSGWLGEDAQDLTLDVRVDGELVAQTEVCGWTNVGADPQTARAVRAFAVDLPEKFADGRARLLSVVRANGDTGMPGRLRCICRRARRNAGAPRRPGVGTAARRRVRSPGPDVGAVLAIPSLARAVSAAAAGAPAAAASADEASGRRHGRARRHGRHRDEPFDTNP
jgi:hypothetical protein